MYTSINGGLFTYPLLAADKWFQVSQLHEWMFGDRIYYMLQDKEDPTSDKERLPVVILHSHLMI